MERFLKKILIFSAIVAALLVAGELVARHIPTSYSAKHAWLAANGARVETLVLGTSHTYYGVVPVLLGDSVYNLANVSQTPEYDLALLRRYGRDCPNLRRVIVPVDYITFRDPAMEDADDWWRAIGYCTRMDIGLHSPWSKYNFEISDFDGYAQKLRSLVLTVEANVCDSLGFGLGLEEGADSATLAELAPPRVAYNTADNPGRPCQAEAALQSIIEYCGSRGAECILVSMPVSEAYRVLLEPGQQAEMERLAGGLAGRNGIRWLDFSAHPDFAASDFHDPDHLSRAGAEKFTRLLRHYIE